MWILLVILVIPVAVTVLPKNARAARTDGDSPALSNHHHNISNSVADVWKKLHDNKPLTESTRSHENQVTKLSQTRSGSTAEVSRTRMTPVKFQRPFSRTSGWNRVTGPPSSHIRTPRMTSIQSALVEQRELKEILAILLHGIFNDLHRVASSASSYRLVANRIGGGKHHSNSYSYSRPGTSLHSTRSQDLTKHVFRRAAENQHFVVEYLDKVEVTPRPPNTTSPRPVSLWEDYIQNSKIPVHAMTLQEKLLKILAFILNPFGIGGALSHVRSNNHWSTPPNMLTWHRIINTHMRKSKKH